MATLFDAFQATAGLASTALSISDKHKQELAEARLYSQQLDMQRFMADSMQDFSTRTDWQNFQKDWENRFSEKFNEYNSPKGRSAYQDQYTARLGNRMLDQMKVQGDIAMQKMIMQGQRNETSVKLDNAITEARSLPASQSRLDTEMSLIDERYRLALDTSEQSAARKREAYGIAQMESSRDWLYGEIRKNPDLLKKSGKELSDYLMSHAPKMSASVFGVSLAQDRREANDRALQAVMRQVKDEWDKNDRALSEAYTNIREDVMWGRKGADELYTEVLSQVMQVRVLDGGVISGEQKQQQLSRLEALLAPLSGAAGGGTGKARSTAMSSALRDTQANIVDAIIRGKMNDTDAGIQTFNEGRELFLKEAEKLYQSDGRADEFQRDFGTLAADFAAAWKKRIGEQYPELTRKIDRIARVADDFKKKEHFKSNPELAEHLVPDLVEFLWDFTASNDFRTISAESLSAQVDDYLSRMTGKKIDWLEQNPDRTAETYSSEKKFARAISAANDDLIFTDVYGKQHSIGGATTAQRLENLKNYQKKDLAAVLGTDSIGEAGWEVTDGGNDRTSTMVFQANGREYKYGVSDNGKKPVLYERNGSAAAWHEVTRTGSELADAREAEKKRLRADSRAAASAVKEHERLARKKEADDTVARSEEIVKNGLPAGKVLVQSPAGGVISAVDKNRVPRGFKTVDWSSLTSAQKKDIADSLAETEIFGKTRRR